MAMNRTAGHGNVPKVKYEAIFDRICIAATVKNVARNYARAKSTSRHRATFRNSLVPSLHKSEKY